MTTGMPMNVFSKTQIAGTPKTILLCNDCGLLHNHQVKGLQPTPIWMLASPKYSLLMLQMVCVHCYSLENVLYLNIITSHRVFDQETCPARAK